MNKKEKITVGTFILITIIMIVFMGIGVKWDMVEERLCEYKGEIA